ncbi:hypothetical protein ETB97_001117 [Aspergillus alliaceus]|uniref:Uncharacterized protein n=1 Tax=Petromyces alliaceus TaxID=209559 RepID=A0A8H6ECJ8_PETAA|nr:hypothetical protein ETB97_001117 [Aspergillus burnettii]
MSEAANVVGTNLHLFFRGEASILEELRKNDILTRFYRHDMEMNMMNERLGDILGQFVFPYPRMTILEDIGRSHPSYTFTDISTFLKGGIEGWRVGEKDGRAWGPMLMFQPGRRWQNIHRSIQQQQQFPPIGGAVNGALILEDHLFEETILEILQATFAAKVQGNFIVTRFQTSLIYGSRARSLVGNIVHPSLISGVGYITRKGSGWVEHVQKTIGSPLLSERDLHKLFAEAILAGHPESTQNPEAIIGIRLINPAENPDIFRYWNPLTWEFIDYASKAASQLSNTNSLDSI